MGKVKQLWEEDNERRFQNRVHYLMKEEGYTEEDAMEKAITEEEDRRDAPNL